MPSSDYQSSAAPMSLRAQSLLKAIVPHGYGCEVERLRAESRLREVREQRHHLPWAHVHCRFLLTPQNDQRCEERALLLILACGLLLSSFPPALAPVGLGFAFFLFVDPQALIASLSQLTRRQCCCTFCSSQRSRCRTTSRLAQPSCQPVHRRRSVPSRNCVLVFSSCLTSFFPRASCVPDAHLSNRFALTFCSRSPRHVKRTLPSQPYPSRSYSWSVLLITSSHFHRVQELATTR